MPLIKPSHHWDVKPPFPCEIDWDHPQAAGLKMCHVFNQDAGPPFDLAGQRYATTYPLTGGGQPIWTPTTGGMGRSGYSTTAYDDVTPKVQVLGNVFPFWLSFGFINTNTSSQYLGGAGGTPSGYPRVCITINNAVGVASYIVRDASAVGANLLATTPGINNGLPHVLAGVSRSTTQHELWYDGTIITFSNDLFSGEVFSTYGLGIYLSPSPTTPFFGKLLWHQSGNGGVPDFARQAREPFSFIPPPSTMRYFDFGSGTAYFSTLSESATSADVMAVLAAFAPTIGESAVSAYSISGAASFTPTLSESTTSSDSVAALGSFAPTLAESVASFDAVTVAATFFASLSESGTAADGMSAPLLGSVTITETVTASDAYVASTAFTPTLAEVVTASDSVSSYLSSVTFIASASGSYISGSPFFQVTG